jgi:hypothetical protein
MSSPKKEFEKKKAREKLKRLEKIRSDELAKYPFLEIKEEYGHPDLVAVIKEKAAEIYASMFSGFSRAERKFYQNVREFNFSYALSEYRKSVETIDERGKRTVTSKDILLVSSGFGDRLIEAIPEEVKSRLFPFNDFKVGFQGKTLQISFHSLLTRKSPNGTIFYGRKEPKISFGEDAYTVGFSRHAIQRICERQNPRYKTYDGLGDAYVFFGSCVYYKPVYLPGGQPAFIVFNRCDTPGFIQFKYLQEIIDKNDIKQGEGRFYYQIGYCPVAFHEGFAVAKTFLIPGYTGTPEHSLLINSNLPRHEKEEMLKMTQDATEDDVFFRENWKLIKWFHENGIPQVMQMKHKVFDEY